MGNSENTQLVANDVQVHVDKATSLVPVVSVMQESNSPKIVHLDATMHKAAVSPPSPAMPAACLGAHCPLRELDDSPMQSGASAARIPGEAGPSMAVSTTDKSSVASVAVVSMDIDYNHPNGMHSSPDYYGVGGIRRLLSSSVASSSTACAQQLQQTGTELSSLPPLVVSQCQHQSRPAYDGEPVWLHIYDVSKGSVQWVNSLIRPVGTGAFHAGVEVFGLEWSFGYAAEGRTGVYSCQPRGNSQHEYRESVLMGGTCHSGAQVHELIGRLSAEWVGNGYHLLTRNCCNFSDALCTALDVGPVPEWVVHLAGAGAKLADGVDQAMASARTAVDLAASIDERYQISSTVEAFLSREIEINEELVGVTAQTLWGKALGHLNSAF